MAEWKNGKKKKRGILFVKATIMCYITFLKKIAGPMDRITKEHRSWNMSRIKSKDTKPELIVSSLFHKSIIGIAYWDRIQIKDLLIIT